METLELNLWLSQICDVLKAACEGGGVNGRIDSSGKARNQPIEPAKGKRMCSGREALVALAMQGSLPEGPRQSLDDGDMLTAMARELVQNKDRRKNR